MNRQEQAVFLLNTFREEVETHVVNLTRVLVDLEEAETGNPELVRDAMRILHTVKGAARMMSFLDITRLAHQMENIVGLYRESGGPIVRDTTNLLFEGLDLISALAKTATQRAMIEAATDNPDNPNPMGWLPSDPASEELDALLVRMQSVAGDAEPEVAPIPDSAPDHTEMLPLEFDLPLPVATPTRAASVGDAPVSQPITSDPDATIRVRLSTLDRLLDLSGEMMIARQQFEEHINQVTELRRLVETQRREIDALKNLLAENDANAQLALPLQLVFGALGTENANIARQSDGMRLRLGDGGATNLGATNLAAADAELAHAALNSAINSFQYTLTELAPLAQGRDAAPTNEVKRARNHARSLAAQLEAAFTSRAADTAPASADTNNGGSGLSWRTVEDARRSVAALEHTDRTLRQTIDVVLRERKEFAGKFAAQTSELQRQTLAVRTQPLEVLFALFPRAVRDIAAERGKAVRLVTIGGAIELDRRVLEAINDPLVHLIRNAIDHGIEKQSERVAAGKSPEGTIRLSAEQRGDRVVIEVYDDGAGIDTERVVQSAIERGMLPAGTTSLPRDAAFDLIFRPGLSTRTHVDELSGRGVGMDIVQQRVKRLNGRVIVSSEIGLGTQVIMELPLTLATLSALLVRVSDQVFALPAGLVSGTLRFARENLIMQSGQPTLIVDDVFMPVVWLGHAIDLTPLPLQDAPEGTYRTSPMDEAAGVEDIRRIFHSRSHNAFSDASLSDDDESIARGLTAIVIGTDERRMCLVVDDVLDEREVIVRNLGAFVARTPFVAGATILSAGRVALILDVNELVQSARRATFIQAAAPAPDDSAKRSRKRQQKRLLVIDDSLATRELERTILEAAGYRVDTAVDGVDGMRLARGALNGAILNYDLIVSDIEMPNMDGFTFTTTMRQQSEAPLRHVPIIIVTSRESPDDRRRGLEAGAQAYIIKNQFDQNRLLETIRRLTG